MIRERASRAKNYADAKVPEAERMEFRVRERDEAIIANYRAEEKVHAKAGDGAKGREDVREGEGIGINKYG